MRNIFAALALAAGMAVSGSVANAMPIGKPAITQKSDVVQARHGGGHGGIGMRHGGFRHGGIGLRHGGHRFRHGGFGYRHLYRPRLYVAPLYGYGYYRGDGCHWLKRKAIRTGSRYWWRRYNECRWG